MARRLLGACAVLVTIWFQSACQPPPPPHGLTDAQLVRLAHCESGGNPRIVSASGKYHGLYQFDQRTWNGVVRNVAPSFVGVAPSAAPVSVQNEAARELHRQRGRDPWPTCGRRM